MPRVTPRTTPSRVDLSGSDAAGRAYEQAGNQLNNVSEKLLQASQQKIADKEQENDQLARVKATNALMMHEIDVQAQADDVQQRVLRNELTYQEAEAKFDDQVSKLKAPKAENDDPLIAETIFGGVQRNVHKGRIASEGWRWLSMPQNKQTIVVK